MSIHKAFRWVLCALILAFGILTHAPETGGRWLALTIFLFVLPLIAQFFNSTSVRVYGMFFGIFLCLQALCRPEYFRGDFLTLPPNMDTMIDARLPGISGLQHVTTDSKGFRTTKSSNYEDETAYRIFAIGGSTTKQIYLDDRKTWTHLLQENLTQSGNLEVEVINTGVHGLRAIHHLATVKETLKLNPDMFIFLVGANDWMHQITEEVATFRDVNINVRWKKGIHVPPYPTFWLRIRLIMRSYTFKKTLLGAFIHRLYEKTPAKELLNVETERNGERSDKRDRYEPRRGSLYRPDQRTFMPTSVPQSYIDTLSEIARLCREHSVACVLVTQPVGYKENISSAYMSSFWMTGAGKQFTLTLDSLIHIASLYNDFLVRFAAERNLSSCDLDRAIEPSFENFYDEMHFNERGAKNVAEYLHNCIFAIIQSNPHN